MHIVEWKGLYSVNKISLKFIPRGPIDSKSLVQVMMTMVSDAIWHLQATVSIYTPQPDHK